MAKKLLLLLLLVASVSGQEPVPSERFYQAIRSDDLLALGRLVEQFGVDARDSLGQTPLMVAVAFGSSGAVDLLLKAGADPKAAASSGATALHWSRGDADKVRLLLDRGADINARSQLGRTPLIVAAASTGSAEVVRMLLAKGAEVNTADNTGATPLMEATTAGQEDVVRLLLDRGANVNPKDSGVPGMASLVGSPLSAAALHGNADLVRLFLSKGAQVNAVSAANNVVKNGPIAFGNVTALHMAAAGGSVDVARILLDAGAVVDAPDVRGVTPLTFAVATDRPEPGLVRLLIERGADKTLRSKVGESPVDWARKYNNPAILAELRLEPVTTPVTNHTQTTAAGSPRAAVERSLQILRATSSRMLANGGCVACHAQPVTGLAVATARARDASIAAPEQESLEVKAVLSSGTPLMLQTVSTPGLPDGAIYNATLMSTMNVPSNISTDALVHGLLAKQHANGSWARQGQPRPPVQDGSFSRTALALRTLKAYGTPARTREIDERIARAAQWLARETPLTTEDRVMQLLGLRWAGSHTAVVDQRVKELIQLQRPDGGWAQTPYLESDAYATGEALYTLRELDVPAGVSAVQRGAAFLLRTQHEDGSWHVKSRALKVQPYFESGFPHGHDQWISQAGTAWAAIALTRTALDVPAQQRSAR
jgi:ankyrin repeat protein